MNMASKILKFNLKIIGLTLLIIFGLVCWKSYIEQRLQNNLILLDLKIAAEAREISSLKHNQEVNMNVESRGESREMPKYKCYKKVWALKIKDVVGVDENSEGRVAILTFEDNGYEPIGVNDEYMNKHKPVAGGYYVVYKGGYKSFSPADAFEDGYHRI